MENLTFPLYRPSFLFYLVCTPCTPMFANHFGGILPDNISTQSNIQSYYYKFSQAALGDENFVIYVGFQAPDEEAFSEYVDIYAGKSTLTLSQDNMSFHIFQCSPESVIDYLDGRIYDGMFYNFEIVLENKTDLTIQILAAHVWDYYRDEVLVDFLQKIVDFDTFLEC